MIQFRTSRLARAVALGLGLGFGLTALPALADTGASAPAAAGASVAQQGEDSRVLRRELSHGVYEVAYSPSRDSLYVAAAQRFNDGEGGVLFELDPRTLEEKRRIELPYKAFALALDDARGRLYVGDTMDASVSAVDLDSGTLVGSLRFAEKAPGEQYYPVHPRMLRLDANAQRLYVTAVADPGKLYVVDTTDMSLAGTVEGLGKWTAGLTLDPSRQRAYVSNFDGQIVVIDTATLEVDARYAAGGTQPTNLALDESGQRLYITDQESGDVVVLNAADGAPVTRIASGAGALSLTFDGAHRWLFVTNREAATVKVFDAESYTLLETFELPTHPNSLAVDDASGSLFVTIKEPLSQPEDEDGDWEGDSHDSVARITP
ncbi:YncE family protein [Halotalea alkalilenta]|uniref:SMP-30/Gluconolactonase/LRE-like region domain-containing protein n=1 Tax=Halotalea alkalilenta TaxID=376489 RepID=A0A172YDS7_9GAMM|nr:beta-propeller fold lactonase family protein [Halotalea alkalilenta]ANF57420.1 hypothetical protein A5892_08040 [Halotalea alkalilenta]